MQLAIVAAGFTPGEADQLRRAMAAWRRNGGLEHFEQRLIDGMRERGYERRIRASGSSARSRASANTAFPESHAASFALLVYVSAWLKHHEPAAFCCALLNSQPMGFYAPQQLVRDGARARRRGAAGRCACRSDWDCTLERREDGEAGAAAWVAHRQRPVDRGGGKRVRRGARARRRSRASRISPNARARREGSRARSPSAGALQRSRAHRHRARWDVAGVESPPSCCAPMRFNEALPLLRAPHRRRGHRGRLSRIWASRSAVTRSPCCASGSSSAGLSMRARWPGSRPGRGSARRGS